MKVAGGLRRESVMTWAGRGLASVALAGGAQWWSATQNFAGLSYCQQRHIVDCDVQFSPAVNPSVAPFLLWPLTAFATVVLSVAAAAVAPVSLRPRLVWAALVGFSVLLAHRNNLIWASIVTVGAVAVVAFSNPRPKGGEVRRRQEGLIRWVLPAAAVAALLVSALPAWWVWNEAKDNEHMDRLREAPIMCIDAAHRVHPEAKSLSVYIGDEFGDDHGLVLAELSDTSGLLVWVHSGDDGFWDSCTIQKVDVISQSVVSEYVTTQPWELVTRYP